MSDSNGIAVYSRALRAEVFEPDYAELGLDEPRRRGPGSPFFCGAEEADGRRRKDATLIIRVFTAKRFMAEVILCARLGAVELPFEVAKMLAAVATWLVGA